MLIALQYAARDKRLAGKDLSFAELKTAVRETLSVHGKEGFLPPFCARCGCKELPYTGGYADYTVNLDEGAVYVTPHTFPKVLDGAAVLAFTDRGDFAPVYYVGGGIADRVLYLAVCKYENHPAYYVFHLDEDLEVVADSYFSSREDCRAYMDEYDVVWHEGGEGL
jgi:hypothetical protein